MNKLEKSIVLAINSDYKKSQELVKNAVKYAIKVGDNLLKLKENTPHGNWQNLFAKGNSEFPFEFRQARKYMRLSKNKQLVLQLADDSSSFNIDDLSKAISDAEKEDKQEDQVIDNKKPEIKQQKIIEVQHKDVDEEQDDNIPHATVDESPIEEVQHEHTLEDDYNELQSEYKELAEDVISISKIVDSDDKLKSAVDQVRQLMAEVKIVRDRIGGLMEEKNQAIKQVNYWKKKALSYEKQLKASDHE